MFSRCCHDSKVQVSLSQFFFTSNANQDFWRYFVIRFPPEDIPPFRPPSRVSGAQAAPHRGSACLMSCGPLTRLVA